MAELVSLLSQRQGEILAKVETRGFATIEQLAEEFGVSTQTVRRDIIALDAQGLLQRFHGGAGSNPPENAARLDHRRKAGLNVGGKARIAAEAVAAIPEGAALYLDAGTTMEATAAALNRRDGLLIFTSNMLAAHRIDHQRHEVRLLGGRVAGRDGSLTGEEVVAALHELRLDLALIGCSAISETGSVMDFDLGKIAVKKAAMRISRAAWLLATPEKYGRVARAEIAPLPDFARRFTGEN